jgi:hypothetical protein
LQSDVVHTGVVQAIPRGIFATVSKDTFGRVKWKLQDAKFDVTNTTVHRHAVIHLCYDTTISGILFAASNSSPWQFMGLRIHDCEGLGDVSGAAFLIGRRSKFPTPYFMPSGQFDFEQRKPKSNFIAKMKLVELLVEFDWCYRDDQNGILYKV